LISDNQDAKILDRGSDSHGHPDRRDTSTLTQIVALQTAVDQGASL